MRAILVLSIVLAVAFVCVEMSAAAPGGDVKASPLFKISLQNSIAKLEGKSEDRDEALPTTPAVCPNPNSLQTLEETCENTCGISCGGTCLSTCQGYLTCSGTCTSTCAGGVCTYHYIWRGQNWWNFQGNRGTNWNYLDYPPGGYKENFGRTEVTFVGSNPPPDETTTWQLIDGYYLIDKWYQNAITNLYDVQSNIRMKLFLQDPWTTYYSIIVHALHPPDASGIGTPIDFYFYD